MQESETFLTIKDQKEVLPHTLSFRPINPSNQISDKKLKFIG